MSNAWFRMYSEFATDPKVQMMSEAMQRRLTMLMCLRCSDVTVTVDVTDRDAAVAFALRIDESDLEATKALFIRKGFIDEQWNLINWERRQFASDSSAARTAAWRDRKKGKGGDGSDDVRRHGDGLEQNRTEQTQSREEKPLSVGKGEPIDSREPIPPPTSIAPVESAEPSKAGLCAKALRAIGITHVNPSHPKLLQLLTADVPIDEIVDVGKEFTGTGKANLAFICTVVASRRAEAATAPSIAGKPNVSKPAAHEPYKPPPRPKRDPNAPMPVALTDLAKTLGLTPPT
jgi:hypothetical protein